MVMPVDGSGQSPRVVVRFYDFRPIVQLVAPDYAFGNAIGGDGAGMHSRVRLEYGDVRVDEPVPFDVYDARGRRVMAKGMRWRSEGQLRLILAAGLYRLIDALSPPRVN